MTTTAAMVEESENVPGGWRSVKLSEVTRIVSGSTPASQNRSFWNGDITWVTPADLGKLSTPFIHSSERRITAEGMAAHNIQLLPIGSVVVSSRAPIGHLGIAAVELCTNQGCKALIPTDGVDSHFLYYALRDAMWRFQQLGSGSTFTEVSKSKVEDFSIPLPLLSEQQRLVKRLGAQLASVDRAQAAAADRLEAISQLPQAYYRDAFGFSPALAASPLTPTKPSRLGWSWYRLTDLARLATGHTPSRSHPEYWRGDIPWLQLADIRALDGGEALDTIEHTNDLGLHNSAAVLLPKNTVCMSRTASIGFCTIMSRPMATSQDFVNWVCGGDVDPWFLLHLLIAARKQIRALGSGAVHNTIYFPTVKAFSVCIPPLLEQRRITQLLNSQLAAVAKARVGAAEELQTIQALPAVLLRGAFSGKR